MDRQVFEKGTICTCVRKLKRDGQNGKGKENTNWAPKYVVSLDNLRDTL